MPSNFVYNTYGTLALSGGILDNVLKAVKDAKEAATSKKETQTVDVFYRGFRSDIQWGKILVIPPQVCDGDFKDIPSPLLKGAGVRLYAGEALADFETFRLAESEYDEVTPELVADFKKQIFQGENNRFSPVLLFVPAWTSPRDWAVMRWENDESKLKAAIAHLCFSCYYNPNFSKLFSELVTTEGKLDMAHLQDNHGMADIFKSEEQDLPNLEKRASVVRMKFAAGNHNIDRIKEELHTEELPEEETHFFKELENSIEDKISSPKEAAKTARAFMVPGQVLREFYPEIEQGILQYPAQNNSGMPEAKLDTSGGPAAESFSPGKPTVTNETVPLRREMQLRGPGFMEDFYRSVVNISPGSLMMASGKEAAVGEVFNVKFDAKLEMRSILQGVCGEIVGTMISAYKLTSRPVALNVPGEGSVGLGFSNPGSIPVPLSTHQDMFLEDRIKAICAKLNDGDLQEILNDSWAQGAVWCSSPTGGFTYEILVRAEAFDDETLTLRYKYVAKTK